LLSSLGKPWAISSFSDRFKEWCKEAGLPHCSAHGVRKAGAVLAAEGGATDAEMQALFGWKSQKQAARYRRKADNAKLADKVATTLRRGRGGDKS
jgi:integrase